MKHLGAHSSYFRDVNPTKQRTMTSKKSYYMGTDVSGRTSPNFTKLDGLETPRSPFNKTQTNQTMITKPKSSLNDMDSSKETTKPLPERVKVANKPKRIKAINLKKSKVLQLTTCYNQKFHPN